MTPSAGLLLNVAIYVALIAFVLYRQMRTLRLETRRLILLPAVLAVIGIEQLTRQTSSISSEIVALFAASVVVSVLAGVWRGTTFRLWSDSGGVWVKGTLLTLVTWVVLLVLRVPVALAARASHSSSGLMIGELLLALAITFAAQNLMIWYRASRLQDAPRTAS